MRPIDREGGGGIAQRGRSLISTIALFFILFYLLTILMSLQCALRCFDECLALNYILNCQYHHTTDRYNGCFPRASGLDVGSLTLSFPDENLWGIRGTGFLWPDA